MGKNPFLKKATGAPKAPVRVEKKHGLGRGLDALIGREVSDASLGPLGTIYEVMVGVANDVWVIRGRFGEVLVPVVDEFVSEVPPAGPIVVRVPDGTVSDEEA